MLEMLNSNPGAILMVMLMLFAFGMGYIIGRDVNKK